MKTKLGKVIWLTGLSGAGKTTLCRSTAKVLQLRGQDVQILDGDELRKGVCADLGFCLRDRTEHVRRVAEMARLLQPDGTIVFVAVICPTEAMRAVVRTVVPDVVEVFVSAPLAVCEIRDPKGLYQRARAGVLKEFTGISSPFEAPAHPHITCHTESETVEESTQKILAYLYEAGSTSSIAERRKTIAVDFDGVIADYDGWRGDHVFGPHRSDVAEVLRKLRDLDWKIVVHTTRAESAVASFLSQASVPFDEINANSDYNNLGPKPVATVYWDDRSVYYSGNAELDLPKILNFRTWSGRA